jgi:hypothetical protein
MNSASTSTTADQIEFIPTTGHDDELPEHDPFADDDLRRRRAARGLGN